ncbi:MAG: hypothetical protein LBH81_02035 [Rickettsiales bacterium]|nr:hypothetical protein [Rickettsiales bacterium]
MANKLFLLPSSFFLLTLAVPALADDAMCKASLRQGIYDQAMTDVSGNSKTLVGEAFLSGLFAKNVEQCRGLLIARTQKGGVSKHDDQGLGVNVDWSKIKDMTRAELSDNTRVMFACGNIRSVQMGVDAALWIPAVVAIVGSFGTATPVVAAAEVVVKETAKAGIKATAKQAAKNTVLKAAGAKVAEAKAAQQVAKANVETALKASAEARAKVHPETIKAMFPGALPAINAAPGTAMLGPEAVAFLNAEKAATAAYKALDVATANISKARVQQWTTISSLAAAGGLLWALVDGDLNEKTMNCQTVNRKNFMVGGECYLACDPGWFAFASAHKERMKNPDDDLNKKVFMPLFGAKVCIDGQTSMFHEITDDGLQGKPFYIDIRNNMYGGDKEFLKRIRAISDQGGCDWKMNDQDFFLAQPIWTESMEVSTQGIDSLVGAVRLDD